MITAAGFQMKYIKVHAPQMIRDLKLGLFCVIPGCVLSNKADITPVHCWYHPDQALFALDRFCKYH